MTDIRHFRMPILGRTGQSLQWQSDQTHGDEFFELVRVFLCNEDRNFSLEQANTALDRSALANSRARPCSPLQ